MSTYLFKDQNTDHELKRLKLIETAFDEQSKQLIKHCGISEGMQCLEIGPGAGGILRWMGSQVGKSGLVFGVDKDIKHLSDLKDDPYKILEGNIAELNTHHRFDIIHVRYVLIHNKEAIEILKKIFALLKPGGYAIIEEPDFGLAMDITGFGESAQNKVNQAICALYEQMGLNPAYGSHLPSQCRNIGFSLEKVEAVSHICNGGSSVAELMGISINVLREKYKSTGVVSDAEIDVYIQNSKSERHWAHYYTTVSVVLKKKASPDHKKLEN
ncbi:MAG: class I SAM-dependent methyltransferase [Nitrospiria bacterium]